MRILFVMDRRNNAGSVQAVANYIRVAEEFGYRIALYGRDDPRFPDIRFADDVGSFDYLVFIIESGLDWMSGLRMPHFLAVVPPDRRVILDADGMYNPVVAVNDYDRNHVNGCAREHWCQHCDLVASRVYQPTVRPLCPEVTSLLFYGYEPSRRYTVGGATKKRFDILHVGHNWWRWRDVEQRLLPGLERIRDRVERIGFVGSWWDAAPPICDPDHRIAFATDPVRFERLGIDIRPPVAYTEVIGTMSESRINIMTQRPLFAKLGILTSKYFEAFMADTIPLALIDADLAESVYGAAGRELVLGEDIAGKLADILEKPKDYLEIVEEVRRHLERNHSYRNRLAELTTALQGGQAAAGAA